MNKEELRQRSDLAYDIESIDNTIDHLTDIMADLVTDPKSEMGQVIVLWNPEKDIGIFNSAPLVRIEPNQPPPAPEEAKAVGVQIGFDSPIPILTTINSSFPLSNNIIVSALTTISSKLKVEQRKKERQLKKLMQTKDSK